MRSLADSRYEYLPKLFPEVEIVEADLEKEGSYDNAIKGIILYIL